MTLISRVKYHAAIKRLEDISPEAVLGMLKDVGQDIARLNRSFKDTKLAEVLKIVEQREYTIKGRVTTVVDLSSAKGIVDTYREHSEGGCHSCVSLGRETIDAQDAESGWYCGVSDRDYDRVNAGIETRHGCRYTGFSPKVKKHWKSPCDSWKPRFSPKLDELVRRQA